MHQEWSIPSTFVGRHLAAAGIPRSRWTSYRPANADLRRIRMPAVKEIEATRVLSRKGECG